MKKRVLSGGGVVLLLFFFMIGCAGNEKIITKVRKDLYKQRYKSALETLDKSDLAKSKKDSLIYFLEKGTLLFLLKRYDDSIKYFQKAKERVDELFAVSIHRQTESFLTNDVTLPYKGEDFERVLIHYYLALNYLMKGNLEDALVETRQVILYLDEINQKYKKKNAYHDDAFIRYLNGILFETGREYNDAYIEYYNSYKAFKNIYSPFYHLGPPKILFRDLKRLSIYLGMNNDFKLWEKLYPRKVLPENIFLNKKSEVIVILETGFIPRKEQGTVDIAFGNRWIRVAFPRYGKDIPSIVGRAELVAGNYRAKSFLMEPLAKIAKQDLKDRRTRFIARAAARLAIKHGIAEGLEIAAERSRNPNVRIAAGLIGFVGHAVASATEKADTRGWYTLPHDIRIIRMLLAPGKYDLHLSIYNRYGGLIESVSLGKVKLVSGDRIFKYYRIPY